MFCEIDVLKNFTKFKGKYLCRNFFLDTIADLLPATLVKKRLQHMCFPVNIAKFLRTLAWRSKVVQSLRVIVVQNSVGKIRDNKKLLSASRLLYLRQMPRTNKQLPVKFWILSVSKKIIAQKSLRIDTFLSCTSFSMETVTLLWK